MLKKRALSKQAAGFSRRWIALLPFIGMGAVVDQPKAAEQYGAGPHCRFILGRGRTLLARRRTGSFRLSSPAFNPGQKTVRVDRLDQYFEVMPLPASLL
jgi:hypothetical protein